MQCRAARAATDKQCIAQSRKSLHIDVESHEGLLNQQTRPRPDTCAVVLKPAMPAKTFEIMGCAATAGPGVFVPASFEVPEVDRKVYDAHALSLNAARQKQVCSWEKRDA